MTWFRICVGYCGIEFVCSFEDIVEVVHELWSLPIPEFENDMTEVTYYSGNPPLTYHFSTKENLRKVQEELRVVSEFRKSREMEKSQ